MTTELVRAGIDAFLKISRYKVVGEAQCGEDAVKWCRGNAVGYRADGHEYAGHWRAGSHAQDCALCARRRVIMVTIHTENPLPAKVMQAGPPVT